MGDYWVDHMFDVLAAAGCAVAVNDINEGWERRSRSSGGFDAPPLGVQWHHTASSASVNSDLSYMINGSPDHPVGNVLLDRTGVFWPVAAGGANTSGKGGPNTFSRGVCPLDKGNTTLFSIEIASNGVGEQYPQAQIDAAFAGSNALNARFGNLPDDVITHALGSGDGYTDRKIDPATAAAVQGPWRPASANTSGTWLLADLKAECRRRAGSLPPPPSPAKGIKSMFTLFVTDSRWPGQVELTDAADGIRWNQTSLTAAINRLAGSADITIDRVQLLELLKDRPGIGPCPFDDQGSGYEDDELAAAW